MADISTPLNLPPLDAPPSSPYQPPYDTTQNPYDDPTIPQPVKNYFLGLPGPNGEGGKVPQDPKNGNGTFTVGAKFLGAEASKTGTPTLSTGVTERVVKLACYEFHYLDLICGSNVIKAFFGGYYIGHTIRRQNGTILAECPSSENAQVPNAWAKGTSPDCPWVIVSGAGPSCFPSCSGGDGIPSDIPTTPKAQTPVLKASTSKGNPAVSVKPKDGELDNTRHFSLGASTSAGGISAGAERSGAIPSIPESPPSPSPKPKPPGNSSSSGGGGGGSSPGSGPSNSTKQIVIIQDDSSQSFVRIT